MFYATSNRKHLIPTKFSDNDGDEIRPSDTVELQWALGAGGRNGRVAEQFVRAVLDEVAG